MDRLKKVDTKGENNLNIVEDVLARRRKEVGGNMSRSKNFVELNTVWRSLLQNKYSEEKYIYKKIYDYKREEKFIHMGCHLLWFCCWMKGFQCVAQ